MGLGNTGPRYAGTRHNAGYAVALRVAHDVGVALDARRWHGRAGSGVVADEPVRILLPETFMNRSGASVAAALADLPEVDPQRDLLVVLDDVDLPLGRLRLRGRGSDGGHRGLADVLATLGTSAVPRLRVGVGRPEGDEETAEWVLRPVSPAERPAFEDAVARAARAVALFVACGVEAAMNRVNAPPPAEDANAP